MKYRRTIVETIVYTVAVEAETPEEAWKKGIHVKTTVSVGEHAGGAEKLLIKTACVARVEPWALRHARVEQLEE